MSHVFVTVFVSLPLGLCLQAMLVWWRQWVVHKQQRQELLESSCCHMEGYTAHR